jgi:hypothetical protein
VDPGRAGRCAGRRGRGEGWCERCCGSALAEEHDGAAQVVQLVVIVGAVLIAGVVLYQHNTVGNLDTVASGITVMESTMDNMTAGVQHMSGVGGGWKGGLSVCATFVFTAGTGTEPDGGHSEPSGQPLELGIGEY